MGEQSALPIDMSSAESGMIEMLRFPAQLVGGVNNQI
jgi:hypothetical protein